jgi:hypothetical protein
MILRMHPRIRSVVGRPSWGCSWPASVTAPRSTGIVYAAATIDAIALRKAVPYFGASSQAQLWLNGTPLGDVPNEKGLRRDEFVVPLPLRAGKNVLVVKLQRFWERRWMFYGSVTDR